MSSVTLNELCPSSLLSSYRLRRSPETDHLCSGEVDQARNTDRDRDVLRMTAG